MRAAVVSLHAVRAELLLAVAGDAEAPFELRRSESVVVEEIVVPALSDAIAGLEMRAGAVQPALLQAHERLEQSSWVLEDLAKTGGGFTAGVATGLASNAAYDAVVSAMEIVVALIATVGG